MTLIDFDKKELLDISHALLSYRTDSSVIRVGSSHKKHCVSLLDFDSTIVYTCVQIPCVSNSFPLRLRVA